MKRSLIPVAALVLCLTASAAHAVPVTPPANKWQSSLTEPTPASGSDYHITKASSMQVSVTSGNVTFKLKLAGVLEGGLPVTTLPGEDNTLQVDLRFGGTLHTVSFDFALANGKTNNAQTKFTLANGSLGGGGVVPDDSIQVVAVRCVQGGTDPGAGQSFCTPGLTAK
jgi:hypothetical protein